MSAGLEKYSSERPFAGCHIEAVASLPLDLSSKCERDLARGDQMRALDREEAFSSLTAKHEASCADAERELGAFVTAVNGLYGVHAAEIATNYWIEEIESVRVNIDEKPPMWRGVTVAAANRLARDTRVQRTTIKENEIRGGGRKACAGCATSANGPVVSICPEQISISGRRLSPMELFSRTAVLACAVFTAVIPVDGVLHVHAQDAAPRSSVALSSSEVASRPRSAVVMRFAVASQPQEGPKTLSELTCPLDSRGEPSAEIGSSSNNADPSSVLKVDPKIQDEISTELVKRLSKKMSVTANSESTAIPVGSLVISGCITKANGGHAVERLVGLNLGASHLEAHVKVVLKTEDGFVPVDEFDVESKGRMLLPPIGPIGLATDVAAEPRETLSADARKLADKLSKKLAKTMKAEEQPVKST